jgi:hypothetical protein
MKSPGASHWQLLRFASQEENEQHDLSGLEVD